MTIPQIEQQIMAEYPNLLKFDGYNHDHNISLQDFIKNFIILNREYHTITNNPVSNHYQCMFRKNRSLGDIFLITKYYFPNITLIEVRTALLNTFKTMYCSGIEKIVYINDIDTYSQYLTSHPEYKAWEYDEWGMPNKAEITDDDIQEKKPVVAEKVVSVAESAGIIFM